MNLYQYSGFIKYSFKHTRTYTHIVSQHNGESLAETEFTRSQQSCRIADQTSAVQTRKRSEPEAEPEPQPDPDPDPEADPEHRQPLWVPILLSLIREHPVQHTHTYIYISIFP